MDHPPDRNSPLTDPPFNLDIPSSLPPSTHPAPTQHFAPFAPQHPPVFLSDDLPHDDSLLQSSREMDLFQSPPPRYIPRHQASSHPNPTPHFQPFSHPSLHTQSFSHDPHLLHQSHQLVEHPHRQTRPVQILPGNVISVAAAVPASSSASVHQHPALPPPLPSSAPTAVPHHMSIPRVPVQPPAISPAPMSTPAPSQASNSASASVSSGGGGRKRPPKSKAKTQQKVSTAEAVRLVAQMDRPPTRRSSKGGWTRDEDDMLRVVVMEHNEKNWKDIAKALNASFPSSNRNDVQCLHRWQKVLQPGLKKGPWTKHEDETITRLVADLGANKWSLIAKQLPGRIGKQCRERWFNHLNPEINKDPWTEQEEQILKEAHSRIGNKWAVIAKYLPGRTDNAIKNHYNATQRRAATRKGRKKSKAESSSAAASSDNVSITPAQMSTSTATDNVSAQTAVTRAAAAPRIDSSAENQVSNLPAGQFDDARFDENGSPQIPFNSVSAPFDHIAASPFVDITNIPTKLEITGLNASGKKRPHSASPTHGSYKRPKPTIETTPSKNTNCKQSEKSDAHQPSGSPLKDLLNTNELAEYMNAVDNILEHKHPSDTGRQDVRPMDISERDERDRDSPEISPAFNLRIPTPRNTPLQTTSNDCQMDDAEQADSIGTPQKSREDVEGNKHLSATDGMDCAIPNPSTLEPSVDTQKASSPLISTSAPILPFTTPPRERFSGIREPMGDPTVGDSPAGAFLLRSVCLDAGTPGGGVLRMTPLGKSPGSMFLNSSPRERGSALMNGTSNRPGGLLTPGGLFASTPGQRRGQFTPSPFTSALQGHATPSKAGDGVGGNGGGCNANIAANRELLPPIFSPPPASSSARKRPACSFESKDEPSKPGEEVEGGKDNIGGDEDLRIRGIGLTPRMEDRVQGVGDDFGGMVSTPRGLKSPSTPRQLFCSTPQHLSSLTSSALRPGAGSRGLDNARGNGGDAINSIDHFLAPTPDSVRR